ncbi:MAG: small multi-drug export protein [Clostridioides sp.]|jgi:uncharacterized membrane protein|nr:small multi-drug export protein [Clostridioides sp.]
MFEYLKIMFLSAAPFVELRGGIPAGILMDLNPFLVYISCVFSSTAVSIPLVIFFRRFLEFLRTIKGFKNIVALIDKKIDANTKRIKNASLIGIILFVGIPIPSTGTWTASMIASVLKMRLKDVLLGVFLGNLLSGFIMMSVSLHLF